MGAATEYRLGKLSGRWVITWWEGGKRPRFRLPDGITKSQAEIELTRFIKNRELLFNQDDQTVAEIVRLYLRDREIDGKICWKKQQPSWRALEPHFGKLRPDDIDKEACDNYTKARRQAGIKDGTIWTDLSVLRAAVNWAVKRRKLTKAPFIWIGPQPPPKDRHLTRAEADRLLAECDTPHLRLFVLLALSTAARAGALFELTWLRVDFERRQVDLRADGERSNKRRAIVPINDTLLAALQAAKEGATTEFVLEWAGVRIQTVKGAFARAAARAGLSDVSPHTLRHTAAVWMAEAGIPISVISQYLGHSSTKVTERVYARYSPDYLKSAAAALELQAQPQGDALQAR